MQSYDLIRNHEFGPWAIDPAVAAELDGRLNKLKPKSIIEFGSGSSTLIFARYAKETGARVVSLEADEAYLAKTKALLGDLAEYVELVHAPLVGSPAVYDYKLNHVIDFALIDGPPEGTGGRSAIFPWLEPHLSKTGWEVWLDDGERKLESDAVDQWSKEYKFHHAVTSLPKRPVVISKRKPRAKKLDVSDVAFTILTGERAGLLADTLDHLPDVIKEKAIVLVNKGTAEDFEVLDRQGMEYMQSDEKIITGYAVSQLFEKVVESGAKYWMHIEDDWRLAGLDQDWLKNGKKALDNVNQVRFRHWSEKTLTRSMVTGNPIDWVPVDGGLEAKEAHWTFNPTLMLVDQCKEFFPVTSERDAQRKAHAKGFDKVFQAYPGSFLHTGGDNSLRVKYKL